MNGLCLILDAAQTLKIIKANYHILDMANGWTCLLSTSWRKCRSSLSNRYRMQFCFSVFYLTFDSSTILIEPATHYHTGTQWKDSWPSTLINTKSDFRSFCFRFVFVFAIYRSRWIRNINNWISNESELMSLMSTKSWTKLFGVKLKSV